MNAVWKKTLFAVLPLAGLLIAAPDAEARKHRRHCHPHSERGWYERGRHHDSYYDRRRWDNDRRRPYYYDRDYYPSRYPERPYYDRPYYSGYPWWSIFSDR